MLKVTKFGGSSLADAAQFKKVGSIIRADVTRRYVVPSAPGKRFCGDDKITDLLYKGYALASSGQSIEEVFGAIRDRYVSIAGELGLKQDIAAQVDKVMHNVQNGAGMDYTASRGEYLNGLLLAEYLGYSFIDAAEVVFFDRNGVLDLEKTDTVMSKRLKKDSHAVIPGFYGSQPDGSIKTFSRGGSDITGSLVANAAGATLYENWTDVSGFLVADPRIVESPKGIRYITYKELRELSYMGASVLHQDSIFPVSRSGIPINIRNTNAPEEEGTMIVPRLEEGYENDMVITGIAGHPGYTVITLEKDMMNSELGIGRRLLEIFEKQNVLFEHLPSGIDTMSVVLLSKAIEGKQQEIISQIQDEIRPDSIEIVPDIALLAVVGHGMAQNAGTSGRIFSALGDAGINVRIIDQGSSEINIIIGVDEANLEESIRTIYAAFLK